MQAIKNTFLVLFLVLTSPVISQEKHNSLNQIVTDSARIFTANQLDGLKLKLTNFERETTNQLVILTIRDLGGESIETYANRVFNQNGLGQEGKDNGILILFSFNDRKVRIEVGYGLEHFITDAIASRIIRNTMIPNFKEEKYYEGINTATDELIRYLEHPEALEELKTEIAINERRNKNIGIIFMIGFLSLFLGAGGFIFVNSYKDLIKTFREMFIGKKGFLNGLFMIPFSLLPVLFGLVFATMPIAMMAVFSGPEFGFDLEIEKYKYLLDKPLQLLWLLVPVLGIAIVIALIKIRFFSKDDLKIAWFKFNRSSFRKSFSSSGSHSFRSSSSSSSSSSFSGGGGSSGGGGASGSW